ncbi:MAG: hypothetical protein H6657_24820 [Ardenticatenaceae bacterium]|nr:hypothetical protein [Ardenticatenaceae bacterium]
MFTQRLFTLHTGLMHGRWTHSHEEQSNAWEETVSARLGPFSLESNDVFVLDHSDVYLGIRLSLPWRNNGRWQQYTFQLGYRACRGEEQVRPAGFEMVWQRPLFDTTIRSN